jgi:hypothetical protein
VDVSRRQFDETTILAKVGKHFNLIETSSEVKGLRGEITQISKRLDDTNSRICDQLKAVRLWITMISLVLGAITIVVLVMTFLSQS